MTTQYILHIFVAAFLGGAIGLEREYRDKAAGFRTHFLVGLGAALFMILSAHGFDAIVGTPGIRLDPSRIASQVVTGIGFIGAGTIIFQKHAVKGLTTAAGLWVTAAIGMCAGAGMYVLAAVATGLVLVCLEGMIFVHHKVFHRKPKEIETEEEGEE
jgi:putative Mg2+ transporter-C (MgtC) family protein